VDEHSAELLFRHNVMRLLQDAGLLTEERTELLLSWRHNGFSIHNPLRRFLSPMSAAAARAECAGGGGRGTRVRGSKVIVLGRNAPVGGSWRFLRPLEACEPALRLETAPERRPSLERTKETSYPSVTVLRNLLRCIVMRGKRIAAACSNSRLPLE
jgi:hypothetical protein